MEYPISKLIEEALNLCIMLCIDAEEEAHKEEKLEDGDRFHLSTIFLSEVQTIIKKGDPSDEFLAMMRDYHTDWPDEGGNEETE